MESIYDHLFSEKNNQQTISSRFILVQFHHLVGNLKENVWFEIIVDNCDMEMLVGCMSISLCFGG